MPVGHPYFGKAIPCRCQERTDDPSRLERLQRYSNMGLLTRLAFERTVLDGRSADTDNRALFRLAFHAAAAYAEEPQGWLVFTGPSGAGKTHLAAAVANRVMELGRPVFFVFVPDLLDHLRSTYTPTSDITYDQLFEQVTIRSVVVDGRFKAFELRAQVVFDHRVPVPLGVRSRSVQSKRGENCIPCRQ